MPKGGAVCQNDDQMSATAAEIIGRRFCMRSQVVYDWAVRHQINFHNVIGTPKTEELIEAVLWDKPLNWR